MNRDVFSEALAGLPLLQYEFFDTNELVFSDRIRHLCKECPSYGKSWACPPAVGTVSQCQEKCLHYLNGLVISSVAEVDAGADMMEIFATRVAHEDLTHTVRDLMVSQGEIPYVLSTESCAICKTCTYPDAPCRFPNKMYPAIESHGIVVTDLAEKYQMECFGGNDIIWFSVLLFGKGAT